MFVKGLDETTSDEKQSKQEKRNLERFHGISQVFDYITIIVIVAHQPWGMRSLVISRIGPNLFGITGTRGTSLCMPLCVRKSTT